MLLDVDVAGGWSLVGVGDRGAGGEVVLGSGSAEDEGIILGGCGVVEVGITTVDVDARVQRKLELEST